MPHIPRAHIESFGRTVEELFELLGEGIELATGEPMFHSPEAAITFTYEGKSYRLALTCEDP